MYADDTHLTFASDNVDDIESHLNEDIANVTKWLNSNRLTLNPRTSYGGWGQMDLPIGFSDLKTSSIELNYWITGSKIWSVQAIKMKHSVPVV